MSIHREGVGVWKIRWREGGRNRSVRVHGSYELAKKIERKKLSSRDENRHLDIRREVHYPITGQDLNLTFHRLRSIVLTAVTTGMRLAEIFALEWQDLDLSTGLIAVRSFSGLLTATPISLI